MCRGDPHRTISSVLSRSRAVCQLAIIINTHSKAHHCKVQTNRFPGFQITMVSVNSQQNLESPRKRTTGHVYGESPWLYSLSWEAPSHSGQQHSLGGILNSTDGDRELSTCTHAFYACIPFCILRMDGWDASSCFQKFEDKLYQTKAGIKFLIVCDLLVIIFTL